MGFVRALPIPALTIGLLVMGGVAGRWPEPDCSGGYTDAAGECRTDRVLYVHRLDGPAVDVTGLDDRFLLESVPVMLCESRGIETARNRSGATGLFQVMPVHRSRAARLGYGWDRMVEPGPNIEVAESLWKEQGWRPWDCR